MKYAHAIALLAGMLFCSSCAPPAPSARVGPQMLTILFDMNRPDPRIAVLDLHDAQFMEVRGRTCTMRNLTANLSLANHISIEEIAASKQIRLTMFGITDTIPYYPNAGGYRSDGMALASSILNLDPKDLIRINGKVMTLRDAASSYPEIPIKRKEP